MLRIFMMIFFCLTGLLSCSSPQPKQETENPQQQSPVSQVHDEHFPVDSLIASVTCLTNPSQSFALYLPPNYDDTSKLPVIIFFDPHGSGSFPVKKYRLLAKEFGCILMGSNNSRNGVSFDETNQIANTLIQETRNRFHVHEKRITLAGFSGGAKVALAASENNNLVTEIIYAGAASPIQHPAPSLSILGFAGVNDMNYTDLISFDQSLKASNLSHFLIEWNGKHEWPDSTVFGDAFYWSSFNGMRNHLLPENDALINRFIQSEKKNMPASGDPLAAAATLGKEIFFLHGLVDVTEYSNQLSSIEQSIRYSSAWGNKQKLLQQEQSLKQSYMQAFQEKDINWWKQEIYRMNSITDPKLKPMYQRLLGFLSLAGYSISGNAIQQNNFPVAEKMLVIYKLADPKNSDVPFLEACLYAKQHQNEKAITSLKQAIALGLHDREKIMNEPALQSLQPDEQFQKIIGDMK